jgi:hypothetical protein
VARGVIWSTHVRKKREATRKKKRFSEKKFDSFV